MSVWMGKLSEGSRVKEAYIEPLHLLSAYSHEQGVVIWQMEYKCEKTNEIPIAEKMIQILKIKGVTITADALL